MSLRVQILDYKYTDKTNTVIDWDASVVGELEITNHADFPLAMTFQISDFKDITSTSGDYSKTFKFPATKNNNNLLKHLYTPNINIGNNITEKKPCRIISDGMYTQLGLIKITGVGGYGKIPSSYSGVFYGNNLTWATDLGEAYMNDLSWGTDGENLEYNKDSIVATWQDEDCNSSESYIVYPITSYGQYNAEGETRTIQLLDTLYGTGTTGSSARLGYYGYHDSGLSYETPLPSPDWRPAVFVKNTLDKLFGSVGYKISSSFMDTAEFKKNVWLLPNFKYNNPDDRMTLLSYGNKFDGEGLISSTSIAPTNDEQDPTSWTTFSSVIDLNDATDFILNTNTDNTGWDAVTGIFTIQEYGYHETILNNFGLFATRDVYIGGSLDVDYAKIQLQVKTVGQSYWKTISEIQTGSFYDSGSTHISTNPTHVFSGEINNKTFLNKGDQLQLVLFVKAQTRAYAGNEITIHLFGSSTPTSATTSNIANAEYTIAIDPSNVEYGQTYNLTDVMNPEYKQIDFIKGIAHANNLQMTTDEGTKTVYIEPFDTFYKPYKDAEDWTEKVSKGAEITDKWIENDLKRSLVFKYKSDSADGKVKHRGERFFDGVEDESPYRETLPTTFEKGDSVFENPFFASTYNAKDMATTSNTNVDTAYSACLWTENVSSNDAGRPDKGFDFLPRLLYWNKYSAAATSPFNLTTKRARVQTWSSKIETIVADATAGGALSTIYPQATMINRDSTTSPILSYGNVYVRDYDDATGVYTAYQTGRGLYDTYYKNMVEMLKRSPRLRTISFDLKVADIINLDFRKLVYVDGVYWRINRVVDYMPNQNSPTKVELIEWFQVGVFAATAPSFGSSGDSSNWGVGGSYSSSTSSESEPPSGF
tara:strand:+ start:431 stop:3055 length:2625 start_codon:yes stop_codon:yes gene_type:complete